MSNEEKCAEIADIAKDIECLLDIPYQEKGVPIKGINKQNRGEVLKKCRVMVSILAKTSDISYLDSIESMRVFRAIEAMVNYDHFGFNVFDDGGIMECIHEMDRLFTHWKGIMLFSSL